MQLTMKTDMSVSFDGMTASMRDTIPAAGTVVNNYNNSRTVNQTNNSLINCAAGDLSADEECDRSNYSIII